MLTKYDKKLHELDMRICAIKGDRFLRTIKVSELLSPEYQEFIQNRVLYCV